MKEILFTILGLFVIVFVSLIAVYSLAILIKAIVKNLKEK